MAHEYVLALTRHKYDCNRKHSSQAYYLREGDSWTPIDYDGKAETWMKPLQRGDETGLVEIPANWFVIYPMLGDTIL